MAFERVPDAWFVGSSPARPEQAEGPRSTAPASGQQPEAGRLVFDPTRVPTAPPVLPRDSSGRERQDMTFGEQAADVGMSIPRGLARGVAQGTGILGDIGQLTDVAGPLYQRYIGSRIRGMDRSAADRQFQDAMRVVQERQTPEERAGTQGRLFGTSFTTGAGRMEQARQYVPGLMEESKTPLGRMISSTGEFIGGAAPLAAVTGGFGGALPGLARGALSEAVGAGARGAISSAARHSLAPSNVMAGLGSGVAGEYASDLLGEGGARFTGAVAGALAPSAANTLRRAVGATPAEQQLAEGIRRSSTGPGLSRQEFEAARQQGLPVTLADVRGVGGIYQRALGHAGEAGIPAADALRARAGNSLYTVTDTASDLGSAPMRGGAPGQSVDFDTAREAAQREADKVLKPAYAQLRANRADMWTPELETVLNNPVGRQAAQAAVSQIAARNRTNPVMPFTVKNDRIVRAVDNNGNVVTADPEFWDAVKQQLQTIAFSERANHGTANDLRATVRAELGTINNYNDIMREAQRFITGRNAFEAGNNALNLPSRELRRQLHQFSNTFTSLDRETFARGVLSAVFDNPEKARSIFNTADNRALNQWRTVLDEVSPGAFDQMRRATQVSSIIESVGNLRAREPDALNRFLRQATTMAGGAAAGAALASRVMPSIEGTAIGAITGAATLPIISKVVSASRDRTSRSILEILSGNAPDKERLVMQILNENPSAIGRVSELARALAQWNTHLQTHSQETQQRLATLPETVVTAPRPTRASGGRITSHHRAKAQALINAADRAKKAHNGNTKPILDMPDETVAKALSLADQAI